MSMEKQGVQATKRLRCLKPHLEEWARQNARLGKEWQSVGDAPWWYNERALLSVFAGAVWRCGGSAFEEYSEEKRNDMRVSSGRVDLWFSTGRHDFWAEAKVCDIAITRGGNRARVISKNLARAKADIRRCEPDGWHRRVAILFGRPYLRPCSRTELEQRITWLIGEAKRVDHDALAWVFPKLRKLPTGSNWVCPGSIVWIKEVRR